MHHNDRVVGYDIELQSAAAELLSGTVITRTVSVVLLTPRARVRSNVSRARASSECNIRHVMHVVLTSMDVQSRGSDFSVLQ